MELDEFACPEPIVIQPIDLPSCPQVDKATDALASRGVVKTKDPLYSVMLDHDYTAMQLTGMNHANYTLFFL